MVYYLYTSGEGTPVVFEFDQVKSCANKTKHGIDFVEAQALWLDEWRTVTRARTCGEERHMVVGRICGKHWSAVITYRGDRVRLISVRRSRVEEVAIYEGG